MGLPVGKFIAPERVCVYGWRKECALNRKVGEMLWAGGEIAKCAKLLERKIISAE